MALKELSRLVADTGAELLLEELCKWKVVFESSEDFEIRNATSEAWSRHQVKAWTGKTSQKNYNVVLLPDDKNKPGFNTKNVRTNECYLHVIEEITDWSDEKAANPLKIKLYIYPPDDKKFCIFSPIDDYDVLRPFYAPYIQSIINSNDADKIRTLWAFLEHKLDERICRGHKERTHAELTFLEIYELLTGDNPLTASRCGQLRQLLHKQWELNDQARMRGGVEATDDWLRAKDALESLCALSDADFLRAINIMHPHNTNDAANIDTTGIKKVVYAGMEKIKSPIKVDSMSYDTDSHYILTAIADDEIYGEGLALAICEQMKSNPHITTQLFQEGILINLEIEGSFYDYLKESGGKDVIHEQSEISGITVEHIRDPANLHFIKLQRAIDTINQKTEE